MFYKMAVQFDQTNGGILTLKAAGSGSYDMNFPSAQATANYMLTTDGTNLTWSAQPSPSGVSSSALNTSGVNATNNVSSISFSNASVATSPKGSGFISLRIPDGSASNGDSRGQYAVDLSMTRSSASNVASGNYSVAIGNDVKAAGNYSVAIGDGAKTSSPYSVSFGNCDIGSGADYSTSVSSNGWTASGSNNQYSTWIGGFFPGRYNTTGYGSNNGSSRATDGVFVNPSGTPLSRGGITTNTGARTANYILAVDTSDATPTIMYTNNANADGQGVMYLETSSVNFFKLLVICGVKTGGGDCYHWLYRGAIKRASDGTTTIFGTPTVISSGGSSGFAPSISILADNTNGALQIQVTGIAATSIRWGSTVTMVSVNL